MGRGTESEEQQLQIIYQRHRTYVVYQYQHCISVTQMSATYHTRTTKYTVRTIPIMYCSRLRTTRSPIPKNNNLRHIITPDRAVLRTKHFSFPFSGQTEPKAGGQAGRGGEGNQISNQNQRK